MVTVGVPAPLSGREHRADQTWTRPSGLTRTFPLWNACRGEPAKAHLAAAELEAHGDWPGTCDSQGTSPPGELAGSEQEESVSIGPMSFGNVQPHQTRVCTQARAHEHGRRGSLLSGALLVFGFSFPSPKGSDAVIPRSPPRTRRSSRYCVTRKGCC